MVVGRSVAPFFRVARVFLCACWFASSFAAGDRSVTGLMLYLDCDSAEGLVHDVSGTASRVRAPRALSSCEGISGRALDFAARPGPVSVSPCEALALRDAITMSLWVRPRTVRTEYAPQKRIDGQDLTFRNWNWRCRMNKNGQLEVIVGGDDWEKTNARIRMTAALTPDVWRHVAWSFSGAEKRLALYVDGEAINSVDTKMSRLRDDREPVLFGGAEGGFNPFDGALDEVRIYDRALAAAEIRLVANPPDADKAVQWQEALQDLGAALRAAPAARFHPQTRTSLLTLVDALERAVADVAAGRSMDLAEKRTFERKLRVLRAAAQLPAGAALPVEDLLVWRVSAISDTIRTPDVMPADGELGAPVRVVAARGEIEPASIVAMPLADVCLNAMAPAPVSRTAGALPAGTIDVRIVKCWFQGATAWRDIMNGSIGERVLTPELLLKDDRLIRADKEGKTNYIRCDFPEGARYLHIGKREQPGQMLNISVSTFPVKDAPELRPTAIRAHEFRQYWLTVSVPEAAEPGLYETTLSFTSFDRAIGEVPVEIRVLPFTLPRPRVRYDPGRGFTTSIYYKTCINPTPEAAITMRYRSEDQYRAELVNLRDHGITNPVDYQLNWGHDHSRFETALRIRREVGMDHDALYLLGKEENQGCGRIATPERLAEYRGKVERLKDVASAFGYRELYIYGVDEADAGILKSIRGFFDVAHEMGVKVFQSGFSGPRRPSPDRYADYYPLISDLLDLIIKARPIDAAETAKWHAKGQRIWAYGVPQAGVEDPLVNRRNYGLRLWHADYDGFCTYLYYGGFGNPWNDFDHRSYRDHNYVYPTVNGVVDTIAWEGVREAVDDIRYATLLARCIAGSTSKEAAAAKTWLDACDFETADLDGVRLEMAQWIERLLCGARGSGTSSRGQRN